MKKTQKSKSSPPFAKKIMISSLFGMLAGISSLFAMLLIFSAICMMLRDPHPLILPLCFFSIYASAFLSGFFAVKRNGGKEALWCGILCGAMFITLLWIASFIIDMFVGASQPQATGIVCKLLCLPATVVGAFGGLAKNSKKGRPKHRKI
jgi:putative membrane protein (TIGR04086 family)